jgi:putative phosphoesterase
MTASVHALLLADTHLGRGQADRLVAVIRSPLERADVILHAGDITDAGVLDALASFAPVHAVLGNNDHGMVLPERLELDLGGCAVAMVHDSGDSAGRAARLRRWFPAADVVVFGHSHIPWHVEDRRPGDRPVQHHVNPGSAIQRRRQPRCTIGWLQVRDGRLQSVTIEPV